MKMQLSYRGYTIEAALSEDKERLIFVISNVDWTYETTDITKESIEKALAEIKDGLRPKEEEIRKLLIEAGFVDADEKAFDESLDKELYDKILLPEERW